MYEGEVTEEEEGSLLRLADGWSECRGWSGAGVTCCSLGADTTEWTLQYRHGGLGFSNCYIHYTHIHIHIQRKVLCIEFKDPELRYIINVCLTMVHPLGFGRQQGAYYCVSMYNDVKIGEL